MVNVVNSLPNDSEESKDEWGKYERPGDIGNMKCHDIFCVIIFFGFLISAICVMSIGVIDGKLWSLYMSWDSNGQYCGMDNNIIKENIKNTTDFDFRDLTEYPYLFFNALNPKEQICVKTCPTQNSISDIFRLKPNISTLTSDLYDTEYYVNASDVYMYKSIPIMNRCIPDFNVNELVNATQFIDGFNQVINSIPYFSTSLNAVSKLWWKILVCAVGSLVISLIWVMLLRCLTGFIVYFVVIIVPIALAGLGVWLFFKSDRMDTFEKIKLSNQLTPSQIVAIVIWGITFIILLIIIFLFKKLKSAVQMFKIASKALGSNWTIIFTPIVSMIIAFAVWALIVVSSVFIYTASDFTIIDGVIEFEVKKTLQYCLIFNLVYFIFISVQVFFTNYYATSAPIVNWYFSDQSSFGCGCTCWRGFLNSMTKSLGTITFVSVVMTPLYIFIIFMQYLESKAQSQNASQLLLCVIKCFKCCLLCFAKIVKYLNKTILTVSQIFNKNYIRSAGIVGDVVISDVIMATLLNGISFFIVFLSKLAVSSISALIFCIWVDYGDVEVSDFLLSACIVFIIAYIISSFILATYDNVIDIIFVCYQSGNAIPGFVPGENTCNVQETIEEAKSASTLEDNKVAAIGPEDKEQ